MENSKIILGAGCFWGVQYYFDQVPGVIDTEAGYSGGHVKDPGSELVYSGTTGHAEVVRIVYDSDVVSLEGLLKHFFYMHDPTQLNRQGPDVGEHYRSVIFYVEDSQKQTIESVMKQAKHRFDKPIVTEVSVAGPFYPAEEYHQKFTEKTGWAGCHRPYKPQP